MYKIGEATEIYRQTPEIAKAGYGEMDKYFGNILNDIERMELLTGDLTQADQHLHRSAEIIRDTYRANHTAYASMLRDIALLYLAQGKFGKAIEVASRSVSIARFATIGAVASHRSPDAHDSPHNYTAPKVRLNNGC
jgi:tetratricopeptide (TPR) repeat protein